MYARRAVITVGIAAGVLVMGPVAWADDTSDPGTSSASPAPDASANPSEPANPDDPAASDPTAGDPTASDPTASDPGQPADDPAASDPTDETPPTDPVDETPPTDPVDEPTDATSDDPSAGDPSGEPDPAVPGPEDGEVQTAGGGELNPLIYQSGLPVGAVAKHVDAPATAGQLPFTGAPVGALTAAGLGLIALGGMSVLVGRRPATARA